VDFRAALLDQTRDFGEMIRSADPSTPVPSCPDWTIKQLFRHVGRGNRWAAQIIADRRSDSLDPRDVRDGRPPEDADAAIDWLNNGAQLIIDAVDRVGPETRVWTFLGARPCGWWIRRRLHEATVHRADAAHALGVPFAIEPALAADGVSEWLDILTSRPVPDGGPALAEGATLHLHATDDGLGADGEWLVRSTEGRVAWEHGHGKGAVAVRGSAADLLQAVMRRIPTDDPRLQVLGDAAVWRTWLERTPF